MIKFATSHTKLGLIVFWVATVVIALAFGAQHSSTDKGWIIFLDNLHWTTANISAAVMAWIGFLQSTNVPERLARRWFYFGLVAYAIGQFLWDIQVIIGWNPFPAPSDLGYLLLGPFCLMGLVSSMRSMLPKRNYSITALDASMLSISILALTLAVYLPKGVGIEVLPFAMTAAYPVVLLTASCFGLLMILHLRPQRHWSWITFQIVLGLQGLIWMWWNLQTLSGKTVDGSLLNELFSVASLMIGVSAMHWRMEPSASKRYESWSEGILRVLPLGGVMVASLASIVVMVVNNILPIVRDAVLLSAFAVIILATIRQLLTLNEREELLEAEKAIAESNRLLQIVIDTVPMGIFWKDINSKYLGCNTAFAKEAGMTASVDIIGKYDSQLLWKNKAEHYRADDLIVMASGIPKLAFEQSLTLPNGQTIWDCTSKIPLKNQHNETIGLLGVDEDITQRKMMENTLRLNEDRFRYMLETSPIAVRIAKASGHQVAFANQRYCKLINTDLSHLTGKDPEAYYSNPLEYEDILLQLKNGDQIFDRLIELNIPGYGVKWTLASYLPIEYENEVAVLGWFYDITDRKKNEEELKLASLVYQNASEGMLVTDENTNIIAINPAFTKITGYSEEEVLGKNPKFLSSRHHDATFYQAMWESLRSTGRWEGEIWNKHKSGFIFIEWLTINTIYNGDSSIQKYVALFSDITERKNAEAIILNQANYDQLTLLPNRRLFNDRLQQEIKKAQRDQSSTALLFIDLDRFKEVNDALGHEIGDRLLIEAAGRIKSCVRDYDTVSRLGGDEFTVILSKLKDSSDIERIAQNIIDLISEPFIFDNKESFVSASIGIALYPDDAINTDDLIKNADQAMYTAKNDGRGCFRFFTKEMQVSSQLRSRLARDLRYALGAQEFEVYYQTIVELKSGHIHKAEALLHWKHPELGFISPSVFIPIAENTGTINYIGDWVFMQAAKQVKHLQSVLNRDFQISINKSPVQFKVDTPCHELWIKWLSEMDLPGSSIAIEITEGLLMDAESKVKDKLLSFRDAGIQVSIDDFGTGYSALSYLKKFDIDYLKIDQSFTKNLAPDSQDLALCEAIVVMAHKLGIKVIAEGVETEQQHDLLIKMGCDYGQGYLFSRPIPAVEFEKILAIG